MAETSAWKDEDQRRLDLLVDGELRDDEYRELLLRCETLPDGWRRCALAFLEAQQWRGAVRRFTQGRPARSAGGWSSRGDGQSWWRVGSVEARWALAASLLVAFGLGWGVRQIGNSTGAVPVASVAAVPAGAVAPVQPTPATPTAVNVASTAAPTTPGSLRVPTVNVVQPGNAAGDNAYQEVTLLVDDGSGRGARPMRIPLRMSNQPLQVVANPGAAPGPDEMLRQLQLLNQQLQQQALVPVQFSNGTHGLIPANSTPIVPVGQPAADR